MDSVEFDGIEYVKASVVAKRFKYATDYIGQLCREKKVDARLVGRTWFVNPDSVTAHKKSKHEKPKSADALDSALTDAAIHTKPKRIHVASPLKNKTVKSTSAHTSNQTKQTRVVTVKYQDDEQSLIPSLGSKISIQNNHVQPRKFVKIEPVAQKKLKIITNAKKPVNFTAEELPSVALSGKVAVLEYEAEAETELQSDESMGEATVVHVETDTTLADPNPVLAQLNDHPKTTTTTTTTTTIAARPLQKQKPQTSPFTPGSLSASRRKLRKTSLITSPLFVTLVGTVLALGIFSATAQVTVNSMQNTSGVIFEINTFLDYLLP